MARRNLRQEYLRRRFHKRLVARAQRRPSSVTHAKAKRLYK